MGSRDEKLYSLQSRPASQDCCAPFRAQHLNSMPLKEKACRSNSQTERGSVTIPYEKPPKNWDAESIKQKVQVRICLRPSNIRKKLSCPELPKEQNMDHWRKS